MAEAPIVIVDAVPHVLVAERQQVAAVMVASGGQGPPGRDGAPGGATFGWRQEISLAVWTVPHNLKRRPSVTVTDDLGNTVGADVRYLDDNIIQITHGRPYTGWVYCN